MDGALYEGKLIIAVKGEHHRRRTTTMTSANSVLTSVHSVSSEVSSFSLHASNITERNRNVPKSRESDHVTRRDPLTSLSKPLSPI